MPSTNSDTKVVILNPASGNAAHAETVREHAAQRGYEVKETREEGDGIALAKEAAEDDASVIAAAGGDGTLNEVVTGVGRAEALDRATLGVVPAGTGNNFAENIGITSIGEGFDALDGGERRRIDLGKANGRPFVNSCVGGLTADASAETNAELKSKLGVLAYVITTLRTASTFEGLRLRVSAEDGDEKARGWAGEAISVLIGNGRRFTSRGSTQANVEDGLFEVTIIEEASAVDLMGDALAEQLLGEEAAHTTRLRASALEIVGVDPDPITFSLDGEIIQSDTLDLDVRPKALRMCVGDDYEPDPDR